jgi:hypothetical protein
MKKRKVLVLDFCAPKVAHLAGQFEVTVCVPSKRFFNDKVHTFKKTRKIFMNEQPVIHSWITVGVW